MEHDQDFVRVHFTRDYDYRPSNDPYVTIAYETGMEVDVEEECAAHAIAAGVAMYSDILEDDLIEGRHNEVERD